MYEVLRQRRPAQTIAVAAPGTCLSSLLALAGGLSTSRRLASCPRARPRWRIAQRRETLARDLDWCVVGGWGVDALLGEQTRARKDLDLLPLAHMDLILTLLQEEGFYLGHLWEENTRIERARQLFGSPVPSAFVLDHEEGRQVDVHVYDLQGDTVVPLWHDDRSFLVEELGASGVIVSVRVRCMSAAKQLACHEGYELPEDQTQDVVLLRRLLGYAG